MNASIGAHKCFFFEYVFREAATWDFSHAYITHLVIKLAQALLFHIFLGRRELSFKLKKLALSYFVFFAFNCLTFPQCLTKRYIFLSVYLDSLRVRRIFSVVLKSRGANFATFLCRAQNLRERAGIEIFICLKLLLSLFPFLFLKLVQLGLLVHKLLV